MQFAADLVILVSNNLGGDRWIRLQIMVRAMLVSAGKRSILNAAVLQD